MIDPNRLARLLDEHAAALELFAAQFTGSPADVVQEAFIKLAEQDPTPEKLTAWLYRVVRNGAISARRSETRRQRHERNVAEATSPWFNPTDNAPLDATAAMQSIRELPDEFREVLVARIWGELSFDEIGELVGVSSSSAHRRYESALRKLRYRLGAPCETNGETLKT